MRPIECSRCGSNELFDELEYIICAFCRVQFVRGPEDRKTPDTQISMFNDVQALLTRCRLEPENQKRLARLVLDIDPTNPDAPKYLR